MDQDSDNEEVSPKSQQNPTKPVQSGGMAMVGVPAEEELPSPWPSHSQRSNLLQEDGGDDVGSKDPEIDDHVATEILPQIHRRKGSDGIDPQTLRRFEQHQQRRAQREIERPVVMIRITIESMEKTYPEFEVSIDQNETVYDLKLKVEERAPDSIDPQRQRLIHRGRLLNRDTRRLRQYNVKDGDNLFLVRSRRKQTVSHVQAESMQSHFTMNGHSAVGGRSRAMTVGMNTNTPDALLMTRSKTPDPSHTVEVY